MLVCAFIRKLWNKWNKEESLVLLVLQTRKKIIKVFSLAESQFLIAYKNFLIKIKNGQLKSHDNVAFLSKSK